MPWISQIVTNIMQVPCQMGLDLDFPNMARFLPAWSQHGAHIFALCLSSSRRAPLDTLPFPSSGSASRKITRLGFL